MSILLLTVSAPMFANLIFVVHAVTTLSLVGLIWTIQLVHYPLFERVGVTEFRAYEAEHNRRITPLVGPLMVIELVSAILLISGICPGWLPRGVAISGLLALAAIWLSTALIQVPCHGRLLREYDPNTIRWLVLSNWIRTGLWTFRGILVAAALWQALQKVAGGSLES